MTKEERELSIIYLEGIKEKYIEGEGYERHPLPEYYAIENAIKALGQESCEDAISREDAIKQVLSFYTNCERLKMFQHTANEVKQTVADILSDLPPVQPKPKTGQWIDIMVGDMQAQACDQCKTFYPLAYTGGGHKYCPNCGCRMIEPQESEEKE